MGAKHWFLYEGRGRAPSSVKHDEPEGSRLDWAESEIKSMVNKNRVWPRRCLASLLGMAMVLVAGCNSPGGGSLNSAKTLVIQWQRLTESSGDTCGRCGNTERSVDEAGRLLTASLRPLGIRVSVVKARLTPEMFGLDPSQSNRIWIADQPLEEIIGAQTGTSRCSGCCGDSDCRTTVVDGRSYETIPPELIVRAGLKVAANMIQPVPPQSAPSD